MGGLALDDVEHLSYLFFSLLALALAPLLHQLVQQLGSRAKYVDRIAFWIIGLLVVGHILPDSIAHSGYWSAAFCLLGWGLPYLFERIHTHHTFPMIILLVGLAVHGVWDGVALSHPLIQHHHDHGNSLSLAVLVHRIPDATFIWWVFMPRYGRTIGASILIMMGLATIAGYVAGGPALVYLEQTKWLGYFQGFVAGSLLHLAFHRHAEMACCGHDHDHNHAHGRNH